MYDYIAAIKFFFELLLTLCHSAMVKHERNDFFYFALKGPKCEIFGFGIFAQIRPVWIG